MPVAPGAGHAHCSLPVPSLWAGLSPHLHFLFGVCFSQLQRGHPDGNHLSGSLWTKPNLFGGFASTSLKAWQVQRNFLNCNFLTTFSKTHRLNLAWSLENIQAKACYVQTVSLSFKSTRKKEGKADIQFYKQLSAGSVTPPQDLCCLLPFYLECLEMTCSEIFGKFMKNKCHGNLTS